MFTGLEGKRCEILSCYPQTYPPEDHSVRCNYYWKNWIKFYSTFFQIRPLPGMTIIPSNLQNLQKLKENTELLSGSQQTARLHVPVLFDECQVNGKLSEVVPSLERIGENNFIFVCRVMHLVVRPVWKMSESNFLSSGRYISNKTFLLYVVYKGLEIQSRL